MVVEAEMMPNYLAASHYPAAFFEAAGVVPVGSRAARGVRRRAKLDDEEDQLAKVFLLSADAGALERLEGLFTSRDWLTEPVIEDMVKFTDLRYEGADRVLSTATGEVRAAPDGKLIFEAVLHPQLAAAGEPDPAAELVVRDDFTAFVESVDGSVNANFVGLEGGMWHLPVLIPPTALPTVATFAQLRVLRPMPRLRQAPRVGEVLYAMTSVPPPTTTSTQRIAVFDGGVDLSVPGLGTWVTEHDHTGQPALGAHREHGTAVTSATLFGPLEVGASPPRPSAGVDHHRIWPLPSGVGVDGELAWVLEQVEKVVRTGAYRVVVITLAPTLTVEDSEPHRWTSALDRMAFDHDVLFVVAAGNNGDLAPGLDRILVPSDLINGLSVGSCTGRDGLAVRDSYSCVGPGRPGAMTAPTGVQFGGNLDSEPFGALTIGGDVAAHEGTSLAAPTVARGCAQLDGLLDGAASANLLRTMAVHYAERPAEKQAKAMGSRIRDVGYGRFPADYFGHLEHRPNAVTVIYEGSVKRRQRIALDIPVPDDVFSAAATRSFKVRWTLGFFAPVEPANPVDYSAAGIQVVFRPHAFRYPATAPDEKKGMVVDIREVGLCKVVTDDWGYKIGRFPDSASKTGFAPEVEQRQHHGKWEGVVRMDRGFRGVSLCRPRLDLHALVREGGNLLRDADELHYVLVAGITAPTDVDIYDRTRAHATLLTPLLVTLPVIVAGT
ncbi:MAG: S8 family peptidase [Vicinamibacterales bacterium]